MSELNIKSFVIPFYRSLLGFWILVLVFGGVFMELKQHILLGRFLFTHALPFAILPIGFLLYSGFHLRYQQLLLRRREYHIFHQTALLPFSSFGKDWTSIFLANHALLIAYLAFLSFFGVEKSAWVQLAILWLTIAISWFSTVKLMHRHLAKPLKEAVLLRPRWKKPLPRFSWFVLELRQNRPILLLLTKGLSLLLLNGFFLLFHSGSYDHRWLEFGILSVAFFQIPLLLEKNEFENSRLDWFKSLPSTFSQKLFVHLGSIILVLFPELLFLLWNGVRLSGEAFFISLPLMLISFVIALLGLIYNRPADSFFQFAFGSFMLFFLVILFGVPWIIPVVASSIFFAFQVKSPFQI
ncbi:hypothetical protein GCM10009119_12480 [Algoriphagus jejuensis]|uniref:Uncharacterized protein n=1 Tax=Algoriphagus jejuensis TaxID=419934 RepID=A0ABP3YC07_9BACT